MVFGLASDGEEQTVENHAYVPDHAAFEPRWIRAAPPLTLSFYARLASDGAFGRVVLRVISLVHHIRLTFLTVVILGAGAAWFCLAARVVTVERVSGLFCG